MNRFKVENINTKDTTEATIHPLVRKLGLLPEDLDMTINETRTYGVNKITRIA